MNRSEGPAVAPGARGALTAGCACSITNQDSRGNLGRSLRPRRGGFLRPFGLGKFIRAYLSGDDTHGACIADPERGTPIQDIRSAYKNAILRAHSEDMVTLTLEEGTELALDGAAQVWRDPKPMPGGVLPSLALATDAVTASDMVMPWLTFLALATVAVTASESVIPWVTDL